MREIRFITSKLDSMPAVVCSKCGSDQSQSKSSFRPPDSNISLEILAEISEEIKLLEGQSNMRIEPNRDLPV